MKFKKLIKCIVISTSPSKKGVYDLYCIVTSACKLQLCILIVLNLINNYSIGGELLILGTRDKVIPNLALSMGCKSLEWGMNSKLGKCYKIWHFVLVSVCYILSPGMMLARYRLSNINESMQHLTTW